MDIEGLREEYARLKALVVETSDLALLQEIGIYQYRHRLQDAAAYKDRLDELSTRIRNMAKRDGAAVQSGQGWAINGSAAEGAKMVKYLSHLMLRSYNNEADSHRRARPTGRCAPGLSGWEPESLTASVVQVRAIMARVVA